MKDKTKWHKCPDEIPPEYECLRVEIWNEHFGCWECIAAEYCDKALRFFDIELDPPQELFHEVPDEVYWRLWED